MTEREVSSRPFLDGLNGSDGDAEQVAEQQREAHQLDRGGPGRRNHGANRPAGRDTGAPIALHEAAQPGDYWCGQGRSSPSALRWAATCSWEAVGPTRRSAG